MKPLNGQKAKVGLQTSMYRDAIMFSPDAHVNRHWQVTHQFCFHILPDKVDVVELEYNNKPYLEWLRQRSSII